MIRSLTALLIPLLFALNARAAPDCSMASGPRPACFHSRLDPVIKVLFVAYGSNVQTADLLRIEKLFKERFESATENRIRVEFVDRGIIDLPARERDLTEVRAAIRGDDSRRTLERLIRIWYYHHFEYEQLTEELHSVLRDSGLAPALAESDIVLALSGPQFEGLGYADGGMGLVEQPNEIAWGALDGGSTVSNPDEQLVDELLHETGHLLGLNHASARCYTDTMPVPERLRCCQASPGSQDVMSYCRDRSRVRGPYYFRYTSCTKDYLFTKTLPALLEGRERPFQEKACD
jgi:hypothetical protein